MSQIVTNCVCLHRNASRVSFLLSTGYASKLTLKTAAVEMPIALIFNNLDTTAKSLKPPQLSLFVCKKRNCTNFRQIQSFMTIARPCKAYLTNDKYALHYSIDHRYQ